MSRFPPPGFAVRVDGQGWRAWRDSSAWRGPWRACYREALADCYAQPSDRRHIPPAAPALVTLWAAESELL